MNYEKNFRDDCQHIVNQYYESCEAVDNYDELCEVMDNLIKIMETRADTEGIAV